MRSRGSATPFAIRLPQRGRRLEAAMPLLLKKTRRVDGGLPRGLPRKSSAVLRRLENPAVNPFRTHVRRLIVEPESAPDLADLTQIFGLVQELIGPRRRVGRILIEDAAGAGKAQAECASRTQYQASERDSQRSHGRLRAVRPYVSAIHPSIGMLRLTATIGTRRRST